MPLPIKLPSIYLDISYGTHVATRVYLIWPNQCISMIFYQWFLLRYALGIFTLFLKIIYSSFNGELNIICIHMN